MGTSIRGRSEGVDAESCAVCCCWLIGGWLRVGGAKFCGKMSCGRVVKADAGLGEAGSVEWRKHVYLVVIEV